MKAKEVEKSIFDHYSSLKTYKPFTEVKTGNTWSDQEPYFRLDVVAFKIGWKNPELIGFEIKVSRSDFKGDKKWKNYLKFVNKFCFACPDGLIKKEELPDNVGLVYTMNDGRLKWIRRPKTLSDVIDETIYKYMCISRL